MPKIFECASCGMVTEEPIRVCDPHRVENKGVYCGTTPERGEICHEMTDHLVYVCGSCGRPAEQADLLCDPLLTG